VSRRKVFVPSDLLSELKAIVQREGYAALAPVFQGVEMSRALLRYPHNQEDDPQHDPEHEERYDDVMMGIYEKTYYYVRSTFRDL
jgi:hypothetical protein